MLIGLPSWDNLANNNSREVQWAFISRFSEVWNKGQGVANFHYAKQKKYESVEEYDDKFIKLCVAIPQWLDDFYLEKTFKEGLRTKVKMEIIGMPRKTLAKVVELTIAIEEEMSIRKRNMARYRQDSNSDEYDELDDEEQVTPKKKGVKVWFDT